MRVLPLLRLLPPLVVGACAFTPRQATAVQPHPRAQPRRPGELPTSQKLYVFEASGMRHVRVSNSAEFVAVSPDRVRFHVALAHTRLPATDKANASTRNAQVWLEDETGRRYEPVREVAYVATMVHPQWRFPRNRACPFTCARFYRDVWFDYATADYVFTSPDIIGPKRKMLVLNVLRPRNPYPLRFVWSFGDGTWVQHHFATRLDAKDHLFYSLPKATTMVRKIEAEAETF